MISSGKKPLLDIGAVMPDRGGVETLADVISSVIAENGASQGSLARAIGEKQQTVSKWASGRSEPKLADILAIEDTFGLPHGTILRRAGYVDDPMTTREAIEADPLLGPNDIVNMLDLYDGAVRRRRRR